MPEDWSIYNNALVDEATIFFYKGLLGSFKKLGVESKGKAGRPPHPNGLILLAVNRAYFKPPYRQREGTAKVVLDGVGITDESVGDPREFKPLVDDVSERGRITKVCAGSAYDSRANFNLLCPLSAEAATKPRENPSAKSGGPCLGRRRQGNFC